MAEVDLKQQPPSEPSVWRVLGRRNFWPYFVGNLLSNSGTWFQNIAQIILVYRLTGSPFLVGVVNFSQFAAVIFLAPTAGAAADRLDRRRLIVAMQTCGAILAAALAVITAAGAATAPVVIVIALAIGVTLALTTPALGAVVPGLVDRSDLPAAMALSSVTYNLSRAIGPVAAVFVIAQFNIAVAFAVNSLSFLALIAAILVVRPAPQRIAPGRPRIRDSMRLVRADSGLLVPLIVVGLVSLTSDPMNTLGPAFSTEILDRPDTFTGFLVGAFGTGAVAAALTLTGRVAPSQRALVGTLATTALGMATFVLSSTALVALAGLFVAGFGFLAAVTMSTSLMHLALEDEHRGRVMALWSLSFQGSRPIGSLVDGALASLAGLRVAGLVMVLPSLLGALGLGFLLARRSRREGYSS